MPGTGSKRWSIGLAAGLIVLGLVLAAVCWPSKPRTIEPIASKAPPPIPGWAVIKVPPVPADLASLAQTGREVYQRECAVCHGDRGDGKGAAAALLAHRPRDFTRGNFKFRTSAYGQVPFDDDLYRTLTRGIPAAGMPSYSDLPEADRWALVAHVKTLARREFDDGEVVDYFEIRAATQRISYDVAERKMTNDAVRRGRELFRDERAGCILCHGPEGRGDGLSSNDLKDDGDLPIRPAILPRGEGVFKTGSRPEDIFRILTNGMCGTPMPSFRGNLTEDERWALVCFVTSLFQPIPAGELAFLGGGCMGCHTIGGGKRIGPDLAGVTARRDETWLRKWFAAQRPVAADAPLPAPSADGTPTPPPRCGLQEGQMDLVLGYLRDAGVATEK